MIKKYSLIFSAFVILAVIAATFQNCSSDVKFNTVLDINSITGTTDKPQYNEVSVGDSTHFPPLKLFFVVDNSGTMQANQISLSSAFSKMFSNDNADNLAPFEATAYIFNTAQASIKKDNDTFVKLPKNDPEYFASSMTLDQIFAGPRAFTLNGEVPGDLVGYRTYEMNTLGLSTIHFSPMPVVNFSNDVTRVIASTGIYKSKTGSVADLDREFKARISVLDPARSAIDPLKRVGVLDSVVDKESGLCALARVMRNKSDFIKPGDMAAFVIVSDEDDADPKGMSCVQSYKEDFGVDEYFDGFCTTPKTTIVYRDVNPNPSAANCKVDYATGFKYTYTYELPKTDVSYYIQQREYTIRQTAITYKSVTHTFTQPRVEISYFTKAPTYDVPRSSISYYKKIEACDIRDGVKFNCTYTFPKFTTDAIEQDYTTCNTFYPGKIPSDALLNDAQYPVTCAKLAPIANRAGACAVTDANKLNCKQNYSAARIKTLINGSIATTSTCAAFATANAASLLAGAVVADAGFEATCADAPLNGVVSNGLCSSAKLNCTEVPVTKTSNPIDGIVADSSSTACMNFAMNKKSSLDNNAVLNNSTYLVTCIETAGRSVTNEGLCSSVPAGTKDCVNKVAPTITTATINGVPSSGQTCKQFIQSNIGSTRVISDSIMPNCSSSTAVQTVTSNEKTISYTNAIVSNYSPQVKGSCLDTLKSYIASTDAVPNPKTCTVKSIVAGSSLHNSNQLCGQIADANSICTNSSGAKRNCVATDVPAGNAYMSALTTATFNGQFNCDTQCADTGFCKDKMGLVKDNFKDCMATYAPTNRNFTRQLYANKDSVCVAPENPVATVTKAAYKDIGSKTDYVAGELTEQGVPNALANYIRDSSVATFGTELPAVSVFVRKPGDSLGTNGSLGEAYMTFADLMSGQKKSVLSDASGYADALTSLSSVIKNKIARSFNIPVRPGTTVKRVWHRKAGETSWGLPVDNINWSANGGTVTLDPNYVFTYSDEFRMESY